ncbi:MAG: hypothetical protein ACFFFH_07570 [Candidatus Thorarchaeota archaeon]
MNLQNKDEILGKQKQAVETIESALRQAIKDSNHEVELQRYHGVNDCY